MAALPAPVRATLLLVGEGEERERLAALAGQLGVAASVRFCGYRKDVAQLLAAADVFVLVPEGRSADCGP